MTVLSQISLLLKMLLPGLLLLAIPGCLLYLFNRQLLRRLALSVGRMLLQMGLMGLIVWVLFRVDSLWLCLLWLLLMSVVSAWVVISRTRLVLARLFLPIAAGTFLSVLAMTACIVAVVSSCPPVPPYSRTLVPVACVLLAHVLVTNIRSLSAFYEHLKADILNYETRLANGQPHWRSLLPFVGQALQAIVEPAAANMAVTGLIVPPMLASGLLLGDVPPLEAMTLTVVLIAACLSLSVISLLLILLLADRRTFDRRGRLLDVSHSSIVNPEKNVQ